MRTVPPAPWKALLWALLIALPLTACGGSGLPSVEDLPGIPEPLRQIPDLWDDLGLPDLSDIADVPQLANLPLAEAAPGRLILRGPTERRIEIGERVPGTDIQLVAIDEQGAEFRIAGLRSVRTLGDSLDYDGPWGEMSNLPYNLRLRIYRIGDNAVRAAGVHQLVIDGMQPQEQDVDLDGTVLAFPYTANVETGETIHGVTYAYGGQEDRGALILGLPPGEYPFRKIGDSIHWLGTVRPELAAEFSLRMLLYGNTQAQVGGVVRIALPSS